MKTDAIKARLIRGGVRGTAVRKRAGRVVSNVVIYLLLIEFVFVFLYPFLFMLINSFKYDADFRNLNRQWILTALNFDNYTNALSLLNYFPTLIINVTIAVLATLGHVLSCSFIAYGVAKFKFKGRNLIFGLIVLTILVPPQILAMPLYIQYARFNWLGTLLPIIAPSFFGFGLKGGLFVFIFMQFYKGLPGSYEEAAKIEGCTAVSTYFRIMLPLSKTSILVVSTLSVIWHWNDSFEPGAYLTGSTKVLSQMLSSMPQYLYQSTSAAGSTISPVQLAACVLVIMPLLLMFLFIQKRFMEGIEFSGLAN